MAAPAEPTHLPKRERLLVAIAIVPCGSMQGMDTFAVSVALPIMQGTFSATITEISWVLTSYLVAAAIFMPFFGWASRKVGRKKLLLVTIAGFSICTILVATSSSLNELILYRFVQGVFSAGLNPLSQQVLLAAYPREEHPKAFSWMSTGRMVGVMVGPILGGFLTELLSWHWVFWANLPVTLAAFYLVARHIPEGGIQKTKTFDFFGFMCLSVAILFLQLLLDQGGRLEWFESNVIIAFAVLAGLGAYLFAIHIVTAEDTYVNPRVFLNRDFVIGMIHVFMLGFMIYGMAGLLPKVIQHHMGHPPSSAGWVMAMRGVGAIVGSIAAGWFLQGKDPRPTIALGLLSIAGSMWLLSWMTPDTPLHYIMLIVVLQGFGIGAFTVPITACAFSSLDDELRPDGTVMNSLARRFGTSIGVSVLIGVLVQHTQSVRTSLTAQITNERLNNLVMPERWNINEAPGVMRLSKMVDREAEFLGFLYDFQLMAVIVLCLFPLVFLMRLAPKKNK
ncbi:MAG: MDR family MFS transporter [Proteobacteria bacterium]|nr:MDR family MFS transporter [Pseudomonadota bacterium]